MSDTSDSVTIELFAIRASLQAVVNSLRQRGAIDDEILQRNMQALLQFARTRNDPNMILALERIDKGFWIDAPMFETDPQKPRLQLVPNTSPTDTDPTPDSE